LKVEICNFKNRKTLSVSLWEREMTGSGVLLGIVSF